MKNSRRWYQKQNMRFCQSEIFRVQSHTKWHEAANICRNAFHVICLASEMLDFVAHYICFVVCAFATADADVNI